MDNKLLKAKIAQEEKFMLNNPNTFIDVSVRCKDSILGSIVQEAITTAFNGDKRIKTRLDQIIKMPLEDKRKLNINVLHTP